MNIEHSSLISSQSPFIIPSEKQQLVFYVSGRLKVVFCRPLAGTITSMTMAAARVIRRKYSPEDGVQWGRGKP